MWCCGDLVSGAVILPAAVLLLVCGFGDLSVLGYLFGVFVLVRVLVVGCWLGLGLNLVLVVSRFMLWFMIGCWCVLLVVGGCVLWWATSACCLVCVFGVISVLSCDLALVDCVVVGGLVLVAMVCGCGCLVLWIVLFWLLLVVCVGCDCLLVYLLLIVGLG